MIAVLSACGDDSTGPVTPVATTSVEVRDNAFSPAAIVVAPGATVTWTWSGTATHSVDFASASITDGPSQSSGTHVTDMPTTPGTYAYQCDHHSSMSGTVLVQ
jgi:plastocyanin